jgi:RHS repeat-associated protein
MTRTAWPCYRPSNVSPTPTGATSYGYDELDRLLSVSSPGSGGANVVGYRYDLDGNRRTTTYDKADRLTQLADWAGRHTGYSYFADGLLQTVTNVDGSTAGYRYDNARRLTQVLNQVNGGTISLHSYTLDAVGNRLQASEVLPRVNGVGGFALGNPVGAKATAGTPSASPTAVPGGPATLPTTQGKAGKSGPGRPPEEGGRPGGGSPPGKGPGASPQTASTDPWTWGFGGNGQVGNGSTTSQASPVQVSGLGPVVAIAGGRYHSLAAKQDGTAWNGDFELGNGTTDSTVPVQATGVGGAVAVAAGEVHSAALTNDGGVWAWGFNGDGELGDGTTTNETSPERAGAGSAMAGMTLDATGAWHNLAAFTTAKPQVTTYAYDRLYQLTGVRAPGQETSYTYDPVGNRLSVTSGGQTTSHGYNKLDEVNLSEGWTYDNNGNAAAIPGSAFGYDAANRLTSAAVSGYALDYTYDGDGKRAGDTKQVAGGGTAYSVGYVYDVAGGLPVVLADQVSGANAPPSRKYVWGPAGLAYADAGGTVNVYHSDGLGSVRAITDGSGNVVQTYRTDAYGVATSAQGGVNQTFQFAGQQRDEDGLVDLRARVYDPTQGRFLQRDPLAGRVARPQSLNRYAYVQNNPVNATDPSGLLTFFIPGIGGSNDPTLAAFVNRLAAKVQNVVGPVSAYDTPGTGNGKEVFLRGTGLESDPDAQALGSRVKRDVAFGLLAPGEQLNFVALSGGATVAFDTALILQRSGISINYIVTIGGVIFRGKPGNVGEWTDILGYFDPIDNSNLAHPDEQITLYFAGHVASGPVPGELDASEQQAVIQDIVATGVR